MMGYLRGIHPQNLRVIALAIVLALVVLFFSSQIDNYFSPRMFNRIATSAAVILPIAIGQALVVMTRNVDLSVGSMVGIVAYLAGDFLGTHQWLDPVSTLLLALFIGAACGAINGALVAYGRVPSIIVTLGTLALYRTFLVEYSDARTITTDSLPSWVVDLPQAVLFSIGNFEVRAMVVIALMAAVIFAIALSRLRMARKLYAVGSNPDCIYRFCAERCASRAFRTDLSCKVREHHGCCWPRFRIEVNCGSRCGWCQHIRWLRNYFRRGTRHIAR
jgi:rhamnose transport system permease protein